MEEIHIIQLDLETYSDVDLAKSSVYRYCQSPAFEILLATISVNHGPRVCYDLAMGETIPLEIITAIAGKSAIKCSYNSSFERICMSAYIGKYYPELIHFDPNEDEACRAYLHPVSWRCSMVMSAYNGLPQSLDMVGAVLGLQQQKMKEGRDLIRFFCMPCTPTMANGHRTRNLPKDNQLKWELFKQYNMRDVEVEQEIEERLSKYPVPDSVWEEYHISERINDRGILIDSKLVSNAIHIHSLAKAELDVALKEKTGLENPGSVQQLKSWLSENGVTAECLGKKEVARMIPAADEHIAQVLRLRQQAAKSSIKKYEAMQTAACADHRCRGMFRFYGANRTGRFSGRIVQLQNLPQNHLPDLDQARNLVLQDDSDMLEILYGDVNDTLSQLLRTAFIPRPGYKFAVSDYSSVEARVLSTLVHEQWRMDAFTAGKDIYCASASQMFGVPVVKHGINGELRQKGKIAELALGYGGSVGALKAMGALDMGLQESELQGLVDRWRHANPAIVKYWWEVDKAVKKTIRTHETTQVGLVSFCWKSNMLFALLPSGRRLAYCKPMIGQNKFGGESITYMGIDHQHWSRIESYGPKIVENLTQAISRDLLCFAVSNLSECFICGHVHDEVIIEVPEDADYMEICKLMSMVPEWFPGLQLRADGYECRYYQKD